jgi:hypothetical protein
MGVITLRNRFLRSRTEDYLLGIDAGNYYRAVADGLWATLPALSEGEHTIHVEVSARVSGSPRTSFTI